MSVSTQKGRVVGEDELEGQSRAVAVHETTRRVDDLSDSLATHNDLLIVTARFVAGTLAERAQEAAEDGLTSTAFGEAARGRGQHGASQRAVRGACPQEWTGTGP